MSLEQLIGEIAERFPQSDFVGKLRDERREEDSTIVVTDGFCFYLSTIVKNFVNNPVLFEINEKVIWSEIQLQREPRN